MLISKKQTEFFPRPLEMPSFPIPKGEEGKYRGWIRSEIIDAGAYDEDGVLRSDSYFESMCLLCHLVFKGARKIYGKVLPDNVKSRIKQELSVICELGYADYFLIVWDLVSWAKKHGVRVGPGRGNAPGSIVNYCLGITSIDPLRHGLLFERFLNKERPKVPDIDIDFDEVGRARVIEYLEDKYGADHVGLVMTYMTTAPRNLANDARLKDSDCRRGIHACAVVLGKCALEEYVPLTTWTDALRGKEHLVSLYPANVASKSGVLLLDFIGVKALTQIKKSLALVKRRYGIRLDIDRIPTNDPETFALYSRGDTDGVFHFEAPGMKEFLTAFKPDRLEHLMMMDALWRPESMDFIPEAIALKHGKGAAPVPFSEMDGILAETYGLTVYQEQVMEIARMVTGLSPEWTDLLRRALCRKDGDELASLHVDYFISANLKGHRYDELKRLWDSWIPLSKVIFSKAHAAAYAWLSYQTAWLKTHYRREFEECFG